MPRSHHSSQSYLYRLDFCWMTLSLCPPPPPPPPKKKKKKKKRKGPCIWLLHVEEKTTMHLYTVPLHRSGVYISIQLVRDRNIPMSDKPEDLFLYGADEGHINLFIYLGFYVAFNTIQVIPRRVVGRAEETSTYSSLGLCTVNCRPTASNHQLSHLRPSQGSNPGLRGGRRECYHSATVPP